MYKRCKFYPSCSQYILDTMRVCTFWYGLRLSVRRLLKCRPGCEGGYDPVYYYVEMQQDHIDENKLY